MDISSLIHPMKIRTSCRLDTIPQLISACDRAIDDDNLDYASYTYLHDLIPSL